jgi:hypothetical protein
MLISSFLQEASEGMWLASTGHLTDCDCVIYSSTRDEAGELIVIAWSTAVQEMKQVN